MRNAWLVYTLIRLSMFFGLFAIFALINFNVYVAAIIAAALSFALSLLLLDKQRDKISEAVHQKIARGQDGSYTDADSDLENAALDKQRDDLATQARVHDQKPNPEH